MKAGQDLQKNHDARTLHYSEMYGGAESAVRLRRMEEGTTSALVQCGRPEEWCDCSMECYSYLRLVQDKVTDDKTTFEKRCDRTLDGPSVSSGSPVD